ncbi:hypothetical protein B0T25DRAFT_431438, partial [Lasiosphaeria hispida]
KSGYTKILKTCERVLRDGYSYDWVDTCCIDKSSSAGLSEAINSMFRWHQRSAACYAYLADVKPTGSHSSFPKSRWFTRGRTLQELLAPDDVLF